MSGLELFANYPQTTVSSGGTTGPPGSGTVETWTVTSSAGFPGPTTANGNQFHISDPVLPGEIIAVTNISGTTWTVTRGAESTTPVIHSSGFTVKQVVTAGWLGNALVYLTPSGDSTGVTDYKAINGAINALSGGGLIILGPGSWYTNTQITLPAQTGTGTGTGGGNNGGNPVCLMGTGNSTTLFPVGAAITGIYYHRTTSYGAQYGFPAQKSAGFIRDLTIDGTNATGASVGLDIGDGWGYVVDDVEIVNFTGTGAVGFNQISRVFWSEKGRYRLSLKNNTTAAVIGASQVASSKEYNEVDIYLFAQTGQNGVVLKQGAYYNNCGYLRIVGNMAVTSATSGAPPGNIAALQLISAAGQNFQTQIGFTELTLLVEGNPGNGTGTVMPYAIYSDGTAFISGCWGGIHHSLTASNLNGAQFGFRGKIGGDFGLRTAWTSTAFPGLGTQWVNNGPDANVTVLGGTVTGIKIAATATGATSGTFFIPSGSNIEVDGSVAPTTFNITPAS